MNITDIFNGSLFSQAAYADNLDSGLSGSALVAALRGQALHMTFCYGVSN